jgi:hypothetical protein
VWGLWAEMVAFPGGAVVGEVWHAPIRIPPERAAMTVASGDRAAQSGHRARLGRLMRICELTRGVVVLPVVGPARRRLGVHALPVVSVSVSVSRW